MSRDPLHEHVNYNTAGDLCVDGCRVADIAAEHSTPTFVYSLPCIRANASRIIAAYEAVAKQQAQPTRVSVHYSLKANASYAVVKELLKLGCGIDCVSAGEVFKALECGCQAADIVFAGVGKSPEEIDYAVSKGVGWFNVENEWELTHIQRAAAKHGTAAQQVALRLNPNVMANTHPSIATGHGGAKFGVGADDVKRILGEAAATYPNLCFKGLHVHVGSQLADTDASRTALQIAVALMKPHASMTAINIGGGMPVRYKETETHYPTVEAFAAAVIPVVAGYHVMLEPGRSIVAEAGVLVTRALYCKEYDTAGGDEGDESAATALRMVIIDGSMVEVIRPALYGAHHGVVPAKRMAADSTKRGFTIVGQVCESTDVVNKCVELDATAVHPGEVSAGHTAGAYCSSMAGNYNARPLVAEVVTTAAGTAVLARRRQQWADLSRDELM
jgi:diaminopimelate decarboxylase